MAIIYPDMYQNPESDHSRSLEESTYINVAPIERAFSVAAGTFLLFSGFNSLLRRPFTAASKLLAGGSLVARGISGHCPVYAKIGTDGVKSEAVNIKRTFIVSLPREAVFLFWRNLENLPLFMKHLESVEQKDEKYSVWKARFSKNSPPVSWKAAIVKERENEFIGWSSVEGSVINNAGKVEFKDAPGGTEVQVVFSYHIPGGGIGTGIARLFNPMVERIINADVDNFKQYIEVGEVPAETDNP